MILNSQFLEQFIYCLERWQEKPLKKEIPPIAKKQFGPEAPSHPPLLRVQLPLLGPLLPLGTC